MTKRSDNKDDDIESVVDTITSVDDTSVSIDNDVDNGGDEKEEDDRNVSYCFGPKNNNHYCSSVGIRVLLFVITVTVLIGVSIVLVTSCDRDNNHNHNNVGSNSIIEVEGNGLGDGITIIPAIEQHKGQYYDADNNNNIVDENEDKKKDEDDVHTDQERVEEYNDYEEEETTVTMENFFRDTIKPSSSSSTVAAATATATATARSRCTCDDDDDRNEMSCNDPMDHDVCFCNDHEDIIDSSSSSSTVYCGTHISPATFFSSSGSTTYSHTFYAIDGCSCEDHTNTLLCDEYGKEQYCYCNMDGALRCEKP